MKMKATMGGMFAVVAISEGIPGVPDGTLGVAMPCLESNDPESIEYEAYLFAPDNEPDGGAYYCGREQWIAASPPA
jgi:hypothetical protein